MSTNTDIFSRIRSFLGLSRPETNPTNGFRNPIWGSEDDEDVDDELYHKEKHKGSEDDKPSVKIDIYSTDDPGFHETLRNNMNEMVETFSKLFSNFKYYDSLPSSSYQIPLKEYFPSFKHMIPYWGQILDSCQEPGYSNAIDGNKSDWDLDGKLSSNDVFDLLKKRDQESYSDQNMPDMSKQNYKVVITSQWKKPDGTIETRKIVKDQNGVVEETTVSTPIHSAKEQRFIC